LINKAELTPSKADTAASVELGVREKREKGSESFFIHHILVMVAEEEKRVLTRFPLFSV
jgi:hypothetical protein